MTAKPLQSSATANTSSIEADVAAISGMPMIDNLLSVVCRTTGMGFAAVARVTEDSWIACAVHDEINFGLTPGKGLEIKTTICDGIRQSGKPVIINDVDNDATYCSHRAPAMYGFKSYISVPIWLKNGQFFGTLCAIDPKPALIDNPTTIDMFVLFAELISNHINASEAYNKLEQANAKLQQAVETGKMGTWSINPLTMAVTVSDYIKEIFGFPVEEDISIERIMEAIDPQYRQALTAVLINALEHHQSSDIEYPITNVSTGQRKWVRATGKLFYNSEGELTEYSGILMDITEQKDDDEKEAKLAAIIESSEDAIISKTLDGVITSWNQSAEKLFGFTEAEAVGKHISIIIPDDRTQEEYVIIDKVRIGERIDHFETIRKTKTGEEIPISLTVSAIKDTNGRVIGASNISRDISRQKIAEERLQNYAERLEILNTIGKTISADLDVQGILQKVTDAATQLTGAAFGAFFHNEVNEKGEAYMLFTLSGAPREAFEKFGMPRNTAVFAPTFNGDGVVRVDDITKDPRYGHNAPHKGMPTGHLPVVSYLAVPVIAKTGEVIGGLFFGHPQAGVFKEEHEQLVAGIAAQAAIALDNAKLYEEIKVLNAKKDEFIGLASHELKTPLTSINGYLQIIERGLAVDDRNKSLAGKALQQVGKLTMLISDLLDVSKIQTGKLPFTYTDFDLLPILVDVTEMMQQNAITHTIELHCNERHLMLHADQQRIEQVLINLITNAIKYSPKSNKVIVSATYNDGKVKVSVQDFGIGIASDQQERIFSRFYRVENLASYMSGLGIGLYISHEIITRHNGKIWVDSIPDEGSVFSFELPAAES